MFEFELHDIIPYLISISLLCSLAYAYAAHLHSGAYEYWERHRVVSILYIALPQVLLRTVPLRHWLVRKVKRKESPDDDIADCSASFVALFSNKRGGFLCNRAMYSLH
ncbi:hypothetical protein BK133_06635 [Paenibacillus sp. FSL H8-0548]|uniref:hypothetical protein n=1 Tax=Paenibacillus sp. FSL H8-0548 TaxID=1920422 RepID=UPI00096E73A3|nr:hypothetical protein [Paenibacillus sp. FSL H8-0548]OMF37272.1 hypothetical protein BK133_06635 [Paenibacillus sp. FSL H8-0548]